MNHAFASRLSRLLTIAVMFGVSVVRIFALRSSADFNPQSHVGSAVDAKGIRHYGSSYRGSPPWLLDRVSGMAPFYPIEERRYRHQGIGMFRLALDPNTGRVVNVTVVKSTGFSALDNSAVSAFRDWRFRPGRWREIDIETGFQISGASIDPLPGSVRLPPH